MLHANNARFVNGLVASLARQNKITVYEYSNNGNHLHLLLKAFDREGFRRFLRVLTGCISMRLGGAKKGSALVSRFWDYPAFTRIVAGGAFLIARRYVVQNLLEALGASGAPLTPKLNT